MASPIETPTSPPPLGQPINSPSETVAIEVPDPIALSMRYRDFATGSESESDSGSESEEIPEIYLQGSTGSQIKDNDNSQGNKEGKTALMYAVERGNRALARKLLREGADVDATNNLGESAIFYAVRGNDFKMFTTILASSPKLNVLNESGSTLIEVASHNCRFVVKLCYAGADIELPNGNGQTLMAHAIAKEDYGLAQSLMIRGGNPRYDHFPADMLRRCGIHGYQRGVIADAFTTLLLARNQSDVGADLISGLVDKFEELIALADDPEYSPGPETPHRDTIDPDLFQSLFGPEWLSSIPKTGPFDPIHSSETGNDSDSDAELDDEARAAAFARTRKVRSKRMVLDYFKQSTAILDAPLPVKLVEYIRDPEDIVLQNILYSGIYSPHWPGPLCCNHLQSLLKGGYTPNEPQARYSIPNLLSGAALSCDERVFKLLLENDADLHLKDWAGRIAAHFAACNINYPILPMILSEAPSTLTAFDSSGRTPLHFAAQFGNVKAVELILDQLESPEERRKHVNQPDLDGWTPICWAIRGSSHPFSSPKKYMATLTVLIENGADLLIRFPRGSESQEFVNTPWHLAKLYSASDEILSLIHDTISQVAPEEIQSKSWSQHVKSYCLQGAYCFNCLGSIRGQMYVSERRPEFRVCYKCRGLRHRFPVTLHTAEGDKQGPFVDTLAVADYHPEFR